MPESKFFNHHHIELLRTALPYMKPHVQKSIEIISKADELISAMENPEPESGLSAASLGNESIDLEAMLSQIRMIGTKKEQEQIDSLLNFFKMQKLLQGYRSFLNAKQKMEESPGYHDPYRDQNAGQGQNYKSEGSASGGNNIFGSSNDTLMEFLLSQLSPDQKNNFESMSMMFNAMPKSKES